MARTTTISSLKRRLLSITHPPPPPPTYLLRSSSPLSDALKGSPHDVLPNIGLFICITQVVKVLLTTKHQLVDCYIKNLAKVLGSEDKAKEKIYKVVCDPRAGCSLGFSCNVGWEIAAELEDLPEVYCTIEDWVSIGWGEKLCNMNSI